MSAPAARREPPHHDGPAANGDAIGATRCDITLQFLIATVTLALGGGRPGVRLGVGIACGTGIVCGLQPARRAARMDRLRALRAG